MLDALTLKNLIKNEYSTTKGSLNGKKLDNKSDQSKLIMDSLILLTAFLPIDSTRILRYYCFTNNISSLPHCLSCANSVSFKSGEFASYCSLKCSNGSDSTKQRKRNACIKKYGVDNPSKAREVKDKMIATFVKNYGVDNPSKSADIKATISRKNTVNAAERMIKSKATMLEKYGVEHALQDPAIMLALKERNLKKYGVEHYRQSSEFLHAYKQTCIDKYGVDNPSKHPNIIQKIVDTKIARYGDAGYNNRAQAVITTNELYGVDYYNQLHIPSDILAMLDDKTSLESFMTGKTIIYAAELLGIAPTTLYHRINRHQIVSYDTRKNQYEALVESWLIDAGIVYVRSDRTVITPLELDFYLPELGIAIEINGIYWHSQLLGKDRTYHLNKTTQCKTQGIQLYHFWDYQFDKNSDVIKSIILHKALLSNKVHARKTTVKPVSQTAYDEFLTLNHLQGSVAAKVKLGLYDTSDNLLSVMSFSKSRYTSKYQWEMIRYCTLLGTVVRGGASKLFSYFVNTYSPNSIITYADSMISQGNVYEQLNMQFSHNSPPNYTYFKNRTLYSRLQFQKHMLQSKLAVFDKKLTEWENMQANGYNRFWNCGNACYTYNAK